MKNLVIIPAYNEEGTIAEVVWGVLKNPGVDLCVVNDGSKDKTPQILSELQQEFNGRLHVIHHVVNTHIPGGIQDGMKLAMEQGYEQVVTMDAGLSHDPSLLQSFFSEETSDLVIGKREVKEGVPLYRKLISYLAARVMNYCLSPGILDITGPRISDCTSGYRKYSRKIFSEIANAKLRSVSFDFHMEALSFAVKSGAKIKEIPIVYKFSNSSFNKKVLKQAISFALLLLKDKMRGKK